MLILLAAAKEKGAQLQKQVEDLTAAEKAVKRASGTNVPAEMSSLMDQLSGFQMKQAAHNESIKKLLHVIASFQTIEFDCKGLLLATPLLTTEKVASLVATCTRCVAFSSFSFNRLSFLMPLSVFGCQHDSLRISNPRAADTRYKHAREHRHVVQQTNPTRKRTAGSVNFH